MKTSAPRPLYLLGNGPLTERIAADARIPSDAVFPGAAAFLPLEPRRPGAVILPPGELPVADVVQVITACVGAGGAWAPAFAQADAEGLHLLLAAPGHRYHLDQVADFCRTGQGDVFLGIADIVERVRAGRHDINNPLAAGMAETQLLLMDVTDPETRRALMTIEEQMRRIRDLVASLRLPLPAREGTAPGGGPLGL